MSVPKNCSAASVRQLLDLVAGGFNPYDDGPVILQVRLWDDRVVVGTYCYDSDAPDLSTQEDVIEDYDSLGLLLEDLLGGKRGRFVTTTGTGDMVCTLCWTLQEPQTQAA